MNLTDPAHLSVYGELNERIQRSIQHLAELNNNEMRMELTTPDEFWHWGADYMGRWIGSMSLVARYTGQDYGALEVARELLTYQNPDGSFGSYTDPHDFQEWFGMGRGLVGLLECYQVHPDPLILDGINKLGDYYSGHYPECAAILYECYSNALEGLVNLAALTGSPLYLEVAQRMADASVVYKGIRYSKEIMANGRRTPCAGQVHCQLSTARGLLDLFELTGEDRYLQAVLDIHEYILKESLWASGGIGFYYFRPEENETCADADWLRLNLQLWRVTNDKRHMDLAERILVNQLYFNQVDNGGFCYLRGLENRAGAVFDACCSHHGPRAFYEVLRYIYTTEDSSTWVNLFVPSQIKLDNEMGIGQMSCTVTEAPGKMEITLSIEEAAQQLHTLCIRIPTWAAGCRFELNGAPLDPTIRSGYASFNRTWVPGDSLMVSFDLQVAVLRGPTLGLHSLGSGEAALTYGPRLYCLNDSYNPDAQVHLAHIKIMAGSEPAIKILSQNRLAAMGGTPECEDEELVFTPLSEVGGVPSGAGRIHTVRSPYYKVWIPVQDQPPVTPTS
jgi:DUF1680 family protein